MDIRTQCSPFHILLLICCAPAWFRLYSDVILKSDRASRLRNRFERSLRVLLTPCHICAVAAVVWRTYVMWRHPALPLASVGSHAAAALGEYVASTGRSALAGPLRAVTVLSLCCHWALTIHRHATRFRLIAGGLVGAAAATVLTVFTAGKWRFDLRGFVGTRHRDPLRRWLSIARNFAIVCAVSVTIACAGVRLLYAWAEYGLSFGAIGVVSTQWTILASYLSLRKQ